MIFTVLKRFLPDPRKKISILATRAFGSCRPGLKRLATIPLEKVDKLTFVLKPVAILKFILMKSMLTRQRSISFSNPSVVSLFLSLKELTNQSRSWRNWDNPDWILLAPTVISFKSKSATEMSYSCWWCQQSHDFNLAMNDIALFISTLAIKIHSAFWKSHLQGVITFEHAVIINVLSLSDECN